jgi:hypothetical protein
MSDQLEINNQIRLMNVLEDFVLKNIKYLGVGDQTALHERLKFCGVNLGQDRQEYCYELTELDKKYIYDLYAQGHFKETEQQKKYRATAVQQIHLAEDENDTVEIPLIDRLPRYYDDILTEIKQFFAYTQSEESISLKQVEKLRKKAFYTYAMHNDCQSLEVVPIEINKIFEKIHNGHQQQISDNVIKKSFLQYAEKILLDRNEVAKISSIRTAVIIEDLTTASIPFVKEGLIHQHKLDGELLRLQAIVMEHKKDCLLIPADSDQQTEAIYIFSENDRKYLGSLKRKYKKRISHHQRKADEIEGIRKNTTQDIIRKKYTGDSETWLKQHLVANQSLYQLIKEIVKKNKQRSHLKNKNL